MVLTAVREQILDDLERMSPDQQKQAAELVHGLISGTPRGASAEDLLGVAGTLDTESAQQMRRAIEAECERIDHDEW